MINDQFTQRVKEESAAVQPLLSVSLLCGRMSAKQLATSVSSQMQRLVSVCFRLVWGNLTYMC